MIYVIFIVFALISFGVQKTLQNKFENYSKVPIPNGLTGKDIAEKLFRKSHNIKNSRGSIGEKRKNDNKHIRKKYKSETNKKRQKVLFHLSGPIDTGQYYNYGKYTKKETPGLYCNIHILKSGHDASPVNLFSKICLQVKKLYINITL